MAFDLVVRNGFVVDGTGTPGFHGDVAVVGDRVVEVGEVDGRGRRELDADGRVVAPGFVDAHTHMDAQVFWDQLGTSSCWHGVTSVVMGNCGFTLAPVRPDRRDLTVRNIERAEDINAQAMDQGIDWNWSTYDEYLDAVEAAPKGINYAGSIGHSALRAYAMGERAFTDAATADDLDAMRVELLSALAAGAVGFTTSRAYSHETPDDQPVASRLAEWSEVVALVEAMSAMPDAVFQLAPEAAIAGSDAERAEFLGRLTGLAVSTRVPFVTGLFAIPALLPLIPCIDDVVARGGEMWGLTHSRGVSVLQSFKTQLSFDRLPGWRELRALPLPAQRAQLEDPETRERLIRVATDGPYGKAIGTEARPPDFDLIYVLRSGGGPNPTVAEEARRRGVGPVELMVDLSLETDFEILFSQLVTPQRDDELLALLRHPYTAMTFSDSGAHVSQSIDSSIQTHLLGHWVRERGELTVEEAVRMVTLQPARAWHLHDRGRLAPGYAADVTVFDLDTVSPRLPELVSDLPGGAKRFVQRADGYAATIVNGHVFTENGEPTDARSGKVLRRGQLTVAG